MTSAEPRAKVTTRTLWEMKERGEKIVALTAYDCPTARLEDASGVELILVGDSLGQVVLGHSSTLPVTVEDMIHHTRAVTRAGPRALVVADMPFMSYQVSVESALSNAGRLVREAGAEAVKLEGGQRILPQVRALVDAGIPCMGHLGLTPQSILRFGGYRVQGKDPAAAAAMRREAAALEEAGCFSLVLEAIPWTLAEEITAERRIPTIGIGAGAGCDGQVLVVHDLLGIFEEFTPRFVKRYAELGREMRMAFGRYVEEVKSGVFPDRGRSYSGGRAPRGRAGTGAGKGKK